MDAFTLLDIEGANNDEMKPTVPITAVEIIRDSRLTLKWDKMFAQHIISFRKFTSEEQSCIASKVNTMHKQRLKDGLNALVKYTEENNLNKYLRKEKVCY